MSPRLDHARLIQVLGIEAGVLAAVASDAPTSALVPHCPGLTLGETVRHVGALYRSSLAWITTGRKPSRWQRDPAQGQSLLDFFRIGLTDVLTELTAHDPDEPCATWSETDHSYGFWYRRLAHETTVHRVDVQGAAAAPVSPVDDDVALDGVDEVLTEWFTSKLRALGLNGTHTGTVALRHGSGGWLAIATPHGTRTEWHDELSRAGQHIDATVSARDPQTLYLWLWGRTGPWGDPLPGGGKSVRFIGDDDAVAQLWALLRLATR